jgi:hypothetical protein
MSGHMAAMSSFARLVEKLFEQIAQLDCRSRFAIGIKRHGAIALRLAHQLGQLRHVGRNPSRLWNRDKVM